MRPSFCSLERPYLAAIVQESTADATISAIINSEHDGAQGFMVALHSLQDAERTPENLRRIFHCSGRPMMPLVYRNSVMTADRFTDDARVELMMQALEAGAAACDIMGDLFDPSPRELTRNPEAIARQKELIDRIHAMGGEALISSHMAEPRKAEEVLEHLQRQQERGADIVKIVVTCDTDEEFAESVRTTLLLKKELKVPFVHLCNGRYARLQRYVAPALGATLTFGMRDAMAAQPTLITARPVLHELTWHMNYPDDSADIR